MRYQISCIGKLSNIEENKIIQKYIERVKNKIKIIQFPQSDVKKEGLKLLECSPKNSILILLDKDCLLYTSPSPRDPTKSRMPSSA